MKKYSIVSSFLFSFFLLSFFGCFQQKHDQATIIAFGTSGEYPPFEFYENGNLVGFDIDLGTLVAKELGKEAIFEDIPFETILGSLNNKTIDAGISMFTITKERQAAYDCSIPYYQEKLSVIYKKERSYKSIDDLENKKIGAQLGSAQELWLTSNKPSFQVITMNNNNQLIEALKAGHLDSVIIDQAQAKAFCKKNQSLTFFDIENSSEPNGILLLKNSPLTPLINQAIEKLKSNGEIDRLIEKWLNEKEG